MQQFNYKKRNLFSGPHLLGTLVVLAGIFALMSPLFFSAGSSFERTLSIGLGAIAIGMLIITSYTGTLIDYDQRRFKEYVAISGFKLGDWSELPNIRKIKLTSSTYISTDTPNGVSPTLSGKVTDYKTLIYGEGPMPVISLIYTSRDKAVKQAEQLSEGLMKSLEMDIEK